MEQIDPHYHIKSTQIKMSRRFMDKKPSKTCKISWIYSIRKNVDEYPHDTIYSGKYLIFCDKNNVDNIWIIIKQATENGLFGDASKVSTKLQRKLKKKLNYVICIYTYNKNDADDLKRIKNNMIKLGFTNFPYKTNQQTLLHVS